MMNFRCILGMHKYTKFLGPENVGGGQFKQRYKCTACGKMKENVS